MGMNILYFMVYKIRNKNLINIFKISKLNKNNLIHFSPFNILNKETKEKK
jgi:hypothetical protein